MPINVAPNYSSIADSGRFLGDKFTALGEATTIHDFKIPFNLRLVGAHWWIQGGDFTDSADFSVVDKDDILGLFAYYGLQPGDVLELKKYAYQIPIPPIAHGFMQDVFHVDNPGYMIKDLYLRCVYDKVGTGDAKIGIVYQTYKEET